MMLRNILRDSPVVRAPYIRAKMLLRPAARSGGVLYLMYHGMKKSERTSFARQLRWLRGTGDFIGLTDSLEVLRHPRDTGRHICLTFDDGRRDAFEHAFPILAGQGVPTAFFVVVDWIGADRGSALSWRDLAALTAEGMEVGSHTLTHRRLSALDAVAAFEEMASSRVRIAEALGRPCDHFAAPYGQPGQDYLADRDPSLARSIGYRSFLTTIPRGTEPGGDAFALPRVRMEPGWGRTELRYALWR